MRPQDAAGLVLFSLSVLCGCEGARVPLASSEGAPMDLRLIGRWEATGLEDGEDPQRLLVLQFNEHEYYLEYIAEDSDESLDLPDTLRFRAYTTPIERALFANVQCIDCEDRLFLLFRYALSEDGRLTVNVVSEDVYETDFEASEALYAFIRENKDREALYEQTVTFRRIHAD